MKETVHDIRIGQLLYNPVFEGFCLITRIIPASKNHNKRIEVMWFFRNGEKYVLDYEHSSFALRDDILIA